MPLVMSMPKLGVNMVEATIVSWSAKEGDTVNQGDHLLDVETDKAVQEITAPTSGILLKILVKTGEKIKCQDPIAVLGEEGEELSGDFSRDMADSSGRIKAIDKTASITPALDAGQSPGRHIRISPQAKKTAMDLGLDYNLIPPSKPGARIVKEDVLAFIRRKTSGQPGSALKDKTQVITFSGTRKVIAERMSLSVHTNAHAVLSLHANANRIIEWREKLKKDEKNISYTELIVAIVGRALSEFPIMNSRLVGEEIHLLGDINIGVAVDTEKGLLVPVIHNADQKNVEAISEDFRSKLARARAVKSRMEDLSGGTFTITNLGMFEIESVIPIINPPECGIIGVGAIVREPVVLDDRDTVKVLPRLRLNLAFDHRLVDGAPAARFLQRVKHLIERPITVMS